MKSTVPVGVGKLPPNPVTVALSCTVLPRVTVVTALLWSVPLWMSVATVGVAAVTVNDSQTLSAAL